MNSDPKNPSDHDSIDLFGGGSCPTDCDEVYTFAGTAIPDDNDEVYEFKTVSEDTSAAFVKQQSDESNTGMRNPLGGLAADAPVNSLRNATQSGMISGKTGDSSASSAFGFGMLSFSALCVACLILFAISKQSINRQTNVVPDSAHQTIDHDSSVVPQGLHTNIVGDATSQTGPIPAFTSAEKIVEESIAKARFAEVVALYRAGNELYSSRRYFAAICSYEAALKLEPTNATACNNLARLLATCPYDACRNAQRARELSESACNRSTSPDWKFLSVRAAAEAECGDFVHAIEYTEPAISKAPLERHVDLERMIEQFQRGEPCQWP